MNGENRIQKRWVVMIALGLVVSGCSTFASLSKEKIAESDKVVREARESQASVKAPAELRTAEEKLAGAREAYNKREYDQANRLAEQATVDADYARATGTTVEIKKKAEDLRQNIKALRQDIELLSKQITLQGGK